VATRPGGIDDLTPREMDVLRLLAEGLPNRKIGERLAINERTVKYHVAAILAKLEAANRTEAVMRAIERGLITV
jgi:DNA-binding NarL/FixJ family response regulator